MMNVKTLTDHQWARHANVPKLLHCIPQSTLKFSTPFFFYIPVIDGKWLPVHMQCMKAKICLVNLKLQYYKDLWITQYSSSCLLNALAVQAALTWSVPYVRSNSFIFVFFVENLINKLNWFCHNSVNRVHWIAQSMPRSVSGPMRIRSFHATLDDI